MALLNDRLQRTGYAHAIAAHNAKFVFSVFILINSIKRLRIFGAEFKNLPHFNTALKLHRLAAFSANVAIADKGQICVASDLRVAFKVNILQMIIIFIRTDDALSSALNTKVSKDSNVILEWLDRTNRADTRAGHIAHGIVIGHLQDLAAKVAFKLNFIDIAITSNANHHRFAIGNIDKRLDKGIAFKPHERRDLVNSLGAWCVNFLRRCALRALRVAFNASFRLFRIRRVTATIAKRDCIFASIS